MSWRAAACALLLAVPAFAPPPASDSLFDAVEPLPLVLEAPLRQLFDRGVADEQYSVPARVSYVDASGRESKPFRIELSVRGHTSRRETECSFPKLKIKFPGGGDGPFAGVEDLKIGTHCGESAPGELTKTYGRLANEASPWREAAIYRLIAAAGVPTLRVRAARIRYVDTSPNGTVVPSPLVRNAFLLEDEDAARKRMGATGEITQERFTTARDAFAAADVARIAFAEAMIGNFDWCLMMSSDDTYRCDPRRKLWNLLAFTRDGKAFPVMRDFDIAGAVAGRHLWFDQVYSHRFAASASAADVEVISQVQRARALFTRDVLDRTRQAFIDRRAAMLDTIARVPDDDRGREVARQYVASFLRAIETDDAFYRPVVATSGVRLFKDAGGTEELCGRGDTVPIGTPVERLQAIGPRAQVTLLDVTWRWAPPHECPAAHNEAAWIDASAISRDFPRK
jgi:hypothetical protein